jgi:hypothetical protein
LPLLYSPSVRTACAYALFTARCNRLTVLEVGMAHERGNDPFWVMWIEERQWEDLPGEFDVGQTGWAYPRSKPAGAFMFSPAFDPENVLSYQVPCVAEDFLRFTLHENA